jgi:hypothetical protein
MIAGTRHKEIADSLRTQAIAGPMGMLRPQSILKSTMLGAIAMIRSEGTDSTESQMGEFTGDLIRRRMRRHRTEVPLFLSSERLSTSWATSHRGWPRSWWSRGLKGDGAMGWP